MTRSGSSVKVEIGAFADGELRRRNDRVATEEPLEIRVVVDGSARSMGITMRTPGNDFELAVGWLHAEGHLTDRRSVVRIDYCTDVGPEQLYNVVNVHLTTELPPPPERVTYISSACGVCGKTTLDDLEAAGCGRIVDDVVVRAEQLRALPSELERAQGVFHKTGGLHAAALIDAHGEVAYVREDVGRHNAVDKVLGRALLDGKLPATGWMLFVSGRAGFEIMQKAAVARVPIVCSVSAPSSLAVDVARRFGMTLVGFLRDERFNIYSGPERILV